MTRRGAVLVAIIGLHVFIAWALATGLARRAIEVLAPPIQTQIVEEVKKEEAPPPPPPPQFERPPVEIPPPDVTINMPVEENTTAIRVTQTVAKAAPAPVAAPTRRTGLGVGRGFPNTEDYYPEASKRLDEQGVVVVRVCVGPDGKLTEEPTIAKSSGSNRLDGGALKLAKAGSGKYVAATEDGKGVVACATLPIKFQLR
ncbi:MAG TPA: TonB family protein [Steroidobacteraceae bacterium]|nr:TonB family protein [Gammaproteobacteria bacterium]HEV2285032.1 TonB family protein [Steroidobacteraceae bacterium]